MEPGETVMAEGGGAEEDYDLQLRVLLHDLVSKGGSRGAAPYSASTRGRWPYACVRGC